MKLFYTILFLGFITISTSSLSQESFVLGFEDLPLMDGLIQQDEELYFDTPAGKIIESYAYTDNLDEQVVMDFYANTLPQLGWKATHNNIFVREDETLTIETTIQDATLSVKFFLQPN